MGSQANHEDEPKDKHTRIRLLTILLENRKLGWLMLGGGLAYHNAYLSYSRWRRFHRMLGHDPYKKVQKREYRSRHFRDYMSSVGIYLGMDQ